MTWELLDGIPAGPLFLFAAGWLVFLVTVLAWIRSRRPVDYCGRCGGSWQRTERGAEFHLCEPDKGLLSLSIRGASDSRGPLP